MAYSVTTSAPIQASPTKILLHSLGTLSFSYSFYLLTTWDSAYSDSFGWYFQLLTVVGLTLSLITLSLGLIADLATHDGCSRAKDTISLLATPLEVMIAVLYWSIKFHDPSLLMPADLVINPWADLGYHLVPAVLLVPDLLLYSPRATISTRSMMFASTILAVVYWCWIELCYYQNGWYPYPMMDQFSAIQRVAVFVGSSGLLTLTSSSLQWVHGKLHDPLLRKIRVN
ncbi:FAR-17a/AIG1-like protein [Fusarium redolens]|uniref:FAR-17a/AIG1-like protein n=1 Tax=Fusarium redolens TaxID=48865 RepID=A0A9P9HK56_FUSRE|nr:FAR-17a/AIG1-like protein [Fusarium redolens]KAH7259099.1 FAR-17a/AIG1-like protein [Fusarium redolens]